MFVKDILADVMTLKIVGTKDVFYIRLRIEVNNND